MNAERRKKDRIIHRARRHPHNKTPTTTTTTTTAKKKTSPSGAAPVGKPAGALSVKAAARTEKERRPWLLLSLSAGEPSRGRRLVAWLVSLTPLRKPSRQERIDGRDSLTCAGRTITVSMRLLILGFSCAILAIGAVVDASRIVRDETLVIRENRAIGSASRYNALEVPGSGSNRYYDYPTYQDDEPVVEPYYDEVAVEVGDGSEDGDEDVDDKRLTSFLDDLAQRKKLLQEDEEPGYSHRRGRRRKLNSHEQGMLLVEALGKRHKNMTGGVNDHRGHPSAEMHNGIMDMLGRSTLELLIGGDGGGGIL